MEPVVDAVTRMVEELIPFDLIEAEHRDQVLSWLASTSDVFRRIKPSTPEPHLVSYVVLLDHARGCLLLAEHRLAGLWLPPGGHVEPGEHPWQTVRREAGEELGISAVPFGAAGAPFFLTRTQTIGAGSHTDVSLWFLLHGDSDDDLGWDRREFASIRWWTPGQIRAEAATRFDPHLGRFLTKLDRQGIWAAGSA